MFGGLFSPFRALGLITDEVPFAVQRRGNQTFVTVSVGKAWQVGCAALRWRRPLGARMQGARLCTLLAGPWLTPVAGTPQVYNCDKLRLLLVGPQVRRRRRRLLRLPCACCHPRAPAAAHPAPRCSSPCRPPSAPTLQLKHAITALACKGDLTFAAQRGGGIVECRRVHRSGEYRGHAGDVLQLLVLGDRLLSLGRDGRLLVWRIGEYGAPDVAIQLPRCVGVPSACAGCRVMQGGSSRDRADGRHTQGACAAAARLPPLTVRLGPCLLCSGFTPTCLAHPDTYLSKVVVGSEQGRLQLWNFATATQLFEFEGWGSAVRCIAPSPALDVVAVGLEDG